MKWFYAEEGKQIGPVDDADLNRYVREGKIKPETMVWTEGMATWQPFSQARPTPTAQSILPPLPETGTCAACGNIFPQQDLTTIEGRQICETCKASAEKNGPPWEQRESYGLFKGAIATVTGVLLHPEETFTQMKRKGGLGAPFVFFAITSLLTGIYGIIYLAKFGDAILKHYASSFSNPVIKRAILEVDFSVPHLVAQMLLGIAIGPFIGAGIVHLCLIILGGAKNSFEATFRTFCYAVGSVKLLTLVPILGPVIAGIWYIVTMSIGLAKLHDIPTGKAVGAVLIPFICCCCCGFLILGLLWA